MVLIAPISPNATNATPIQSESDRGKAFSVPAVSNVSPVSPVTATETVTTVTTPAQSGLSALVSELKDVLDAKNLQLLKQLIPNLNEATETLLLLTENVTAENESPLSKDIRKIFNTIAQSGATLSEINLHSPESTLAALKQFASPEAKKILDQVTGELNEKLSTIPTRQEARIVGEVLKHIDRLLSADHKDQQLIQNLLTDLIKGLPRLFAPMPELLGNKAPLSEELTILLKTLEQNLQEIIQSKVGAKELRSALLQAQLGLNDFMKGASLKDVEQAFELLDLVGSMHQLQNAQSNLQQLNSLLNTFGEPSLFLFATLIGGSFTKLKFTHDPQDEEGKKNRGKRSGKYSMISLSLNLPAIGPVCVDLGYKQKELLMKITMTNESVVDFLKPRGVLLRKSLKELGYNVKDFSIEHGEIQNHIVPETMIVRDGVFA